MLTSALEQDARRAVQELDGSTVDGRRIRVRFSRRREASQRTSIRGHSEKKPDVPEGLLDSEDEEEEQYDTEMKGLFPASTSSLSRVHSETVGLKKRTLREDEPEKKVCKKKIKPKWVRVEERTVVITRVSSERIQDLVLKRARSLGDVTKVNLQPVEQAKTIHVEYKTPIEAQKAVDELNSTTFRRVRVVAYILSVRSRSDCRVLVRNIPFKCKEEDIKKLFGKYGRILELSMPRNDEADRLKGFAFVQYCDPLLAAKAVEVLDSHKLGNRKLRVSICLPREQYRECKEGKDKNEGVDSDQRVSTAESRPRPGDDDEERKTKEGEEMSGSLSKTPVRKKKVASAKQLKRQQDELRRTLFIRSLPVSVTEDGLRERFAEYGSVVYCKLVRDSMTNNCSGSAFVCYEQVDSANKVLELASSLDMDREKDKEGIPFLTYDGSPMHVSRALTRGEAEHLISTKSSQHNRKEPEDKRNLKLATVGELSRTDMEALGMSSKDVSRRLLWQQDRKKKLKNVNFFVSPTRLCIRNLPLNIGQGELRTVFSKAAAGVQSAQRVRIRQVKIVRDRERKDSSGELRSKGYAFVEFEKHDLAKAALLALNNSAEPPFSPSRRPIVEFAIESIYALEKHRFGKLASIRKQEALKTQTQTTDRNSGRLRVPKHIQDNGREMVNARKRKMSARQSPRQLKRGNFG